MHVTVHVTLSSCTYKHIQTICVYIPHRIHLWYTHLHLVDFHNYGKCRTTIHGSPMAMNPFFEKDFLNVKLTLKWHAQAMLLFRDAGALKSSPAFNAAFETRDIGWPNARRFLNLHFWISRDFSGQWWLKTRDHKAKSVRFPLIKICKDVFCRIKAGYRLPTPIFLGRFIQILKGEMNSLQDTSWYTAHAASKEINGCTAQRLRTWT